MDLKTASETQSDSHENINTLCQAPKSANIKRGILLVSEMEFAVCQADGTFLLILWMLTPAFCCSYLMGFALEHCKTDQLLSLK